MAVERRAWFLYFERRVVYSIFVRSAASPPLPSPPCVDENDDVDAPLVVAGVETESKSRELRKSHSSSGDSRAFFMS